MQLISKIKKIVLYIAAVSFLSFIFQTITVYAANFSFYNYSTNSYENYTGKQVSYTYNNRDLALEYPGILISGTALADYEDLFVAELGLTAERSGDTITISDGTTDLILTIGSKKVLVNDRADTISVAPVKLKIEDTVKYYVPTRYVAETFGYDYVWASNNSTVRITKTFPLVFGETYVTYNGTIYTTNYNNNKITTDMPVVFYDGSVMVPGKQFFESLGCIYTENGKAIAIQKGELNLQLELDSNIAYINERKQIYVTVPIKVTDFVSGNTEVYLSLEFVADMLGFEWSLDESAKIYSLNEGEFTGNPALFSNKQDSIWQKEPVIQQKATMAKEQPEIIYYEWIASGTNPNPDKKFLSKVRAYAGENADVVELYGITKDDIHDFFDNGLIVFEMKNVDTDIDTQYFSDYSTQHLNYTLMTEVNDTIKLFFYVPVEDKWTIFETADGVIVYFSNTDMLIEELPVSSESISEYPEDKMIIPLPEAIDIIQISDEDFYLENKFILKLSGNHEDFYKNNPIINPYYGIVVSEVNYDFVNNLTNIIFQTKYICGYKYIPESGYLAVSIGKPGNFYQNIVIFDAGHGGIDPGASKNGVREKDINFKIVNTYIKEMFTNSNIKVYFTRETDEKIDLYERAAFASKVGADMFISLHLNSNNSTSVNGTEVYYSEKNNSTSPLGLNSYQLGKALVENLCTALKSKNRGVIKSDFVVAKYNTVPAVLIELGYMTNKTELSKLKDEAYQRKAAETIYQTVTKLFETYY